MIEAVYIHIPFCSSICTYCAFSKVLYYKDWVNKYLCTLEKEIKEYYMEDEIKTIYIGGGTPSCLSISEIKRLLKLTNLFKKEHLEEFTFECNIEDINEDLLSTLKEYGVNRLSIGIESFDEYNLKFMNRKCDYEDVKNKVSLIRKMGFNNLNLDLIYAMPNEKLKTLKKDLKLLTSLNPEHISTYSLMIEDNTYLSYKKVKGLDEDADAEMYEYIRSFLKKQHYNHYEVSNFAKDGYESKHNSIYWQNKEYYGFGCGASGYVYGVRYNNPKSLSTYFNDFKKEEEILSKKDIMEYEVILGLRLLKGINTKKFYEKYKVNIQDVFNVREELKEKDLIYEDGYLKINPKKIYLMNEILVKLV